jgi:ubiquinone/menaquinone biosynthesis C-methylase UbiE
VTAASPPAANLDVDSYDSLQRFCSYWTQIEEVMRVTPVGASLLEIGKGTGVTAWYLENKGLHVMTADHSDEKRPTVLADVRQLPFGARSFNTVVAFQILEHLEFDHFIPCLRELARVAGDNVIVSLPNATGRIAVSAALPRIGRVRKVWDLPFLKRKEVLAKPFHHWEIGVDGYPLQRIRRCMADAGLRIEREFRFVENPYHHFFVMQKARS